MADLTCCTRRLATATALGLALVPAGAGGEAAAGRALEPGGGPGTVLSVRGTRFALNQAPTFLLGLSVYGALGAPEAFLVRDLDAARAHGFNWLRVWATWAAFGQDVSAVGPDGQPREPFFARLRWLLAECDRRGMVVDVTLHRARPAPGKPGDGGLPDLESHRRAVEALFTALKPYRNWYLDLANERDIRDARYVPAAELRELRERVRQLDPDRLVTASFGGHDLSEDDLREAVLEIGVDVVAPHRPRSAESPAQTEAATRQCLRGLHALGREVPIHYQEPFRRGYSRCEPRAEDFLTDLRGAVVGGAAGWCLHNGAQRDAPEQEPRRSFDLRQRRLFEQLDAEELRVVGEAAAQLQAAPRPVMTPDEGARCGQPAQPPPSVGRSGREGRARERRSRVLSGSAGDDREYPPRGPRPGGWRRSGR